MITFYINELLTMVSDEGKKLFKFQDNGDAPPRYRVVNYQRVDDGMFQWREVGTYMSEYTRLFEMHELQLEVCQCKI